MTILEKGINLVFYVLFTKPNLTKSVKECPLPIQVWNEMKFDWTNDWYLLSINILKIKMTRKVSTTKKTFLYVKKQVWLLSVISVLTLSWITRPVCGRKGKPTPNTSDWEFC